MGLELVKRHSILGALSIIRIFFVLLLFLNPNTFSVRQLNNENIDNSRN